MLRSFLTTVTRFWWPNATSPRLADHALVERVRAAETGLRGLPDTELATRTGELRCRVVAATGVAEDVWADMFALACEALRRELNVTLYDVQLLGGIALTRGAVAEMLTGEGKTFTTLLPAACQALAGQGVHVMTVNDYLARRDFELLAPVLRRLGFTVGMVGAESPPDAKRAAYACDITFGPGYEFGFDYLRDQVAALMQPPPRLGESLRARRRGTLPSAPRPMQRGQAAAIVDEADSVMIDEATTPLVLAAGGDEPAANADVYRAALRASGQLEAGLHFQVDEAAATLHLTRAGAEFLSDRPDQIPRRGLDRPWPVYVEQALRAERLFRRDVHYVVVDATVRLVDQYTGRIFTDRSWRDGLQQAVQAKEGVSITTETKSLARITRQRYFRRYKFLCGMTGTAQGAERELRDVYGLDVVVIPPHRPCRRTNLPIRICANLAAKEEAIIAEVERLHRLRRPVLIGTAAIEASERLARRLDERGIPYCLLNGKQDAAEAEIVARAGQLGAVTVATNMAGRGTDITLGPGVVELGGLHVIAGEPQESTRVDRQLVGRTARQGDPGSCQLFASADDPLFSRHAPGLASRIRRQAGEGRELPGGGGLGRLIPVVQHRVDRILARRRREMFAHDDWLETVLRELS